MTSRERAMQAVEYYNSSVLRARAGAGLTGPGRASFNAPHNPMRAAPCNLNHSSGSNKDALYRSNSSLELTPDHAHCHAHVPGACGALRREYGSQGSIDVIGGGGGPPMSTGESFFAMLRDYRPAVLSVMATDQRSPGPSEYLRGKVESPPAADNATNTLAAGSGGGSSAEEAPPVNTSPKLRLKLQRLWGGGPPAAAIAAPGAPVPAPTVNGLHGKQPRASASPEDILTPPQDSDTRRKAFAHYDVQSMTANLSYAARLRGLLLARRRNTTTGASAASMLGTRSATPDTPVGESGDEDVGDGNANHLLESCPFFRNEVGGEAERVVSLTRSAPRTSGPLHRPALASGISVLEFPPGASHWKQSACPYQRLQPTAESVDQGALYYRRFFYGQEHQNWFGMDENLGPVAASIKREPVERPAKLSSDCSSGATPQPVYQYRVLIRTSELFTLRGSVLEDAIPNLKATNNTNNNNNKAMMNTKEVLEYVAPELQLSCLRLGVASPQTEEQLLKLDEQGLSNHYKVGIMYCRAGQGTEEEMYNNEDAGPAFQEFLETIGQRVRLKGFDKYKAGLDNKTDSTGLYSVYAQHDDCEIMFHVSTMLPFTPNNRQQLLRKRHIGNDIVTIVFQEPGAHPFTPKNIRSQFQHVFIVVRAINPCSDVTQYSVAVSRSKEVPMFGPPIKEGATYPKGKAFADFLLAKVINAENAAHRSEKFATMATRTRQEYLKDLANNYTVTTLVKTGQKFSMLSFSSKKSRDKDKERGGVRPARFLPDATQRGALCWQVVLEDSGQAALVDCFLAISADSVVLVEERSREIVFVTPCSSVLGWAVQGNSLRLYHHQGECTRLHLREEPAKGAVDLKEVMVRLRSVTPGSIAQELALRRNHMGQLGFHVQPDGVVTQVESHGQAWQAGLRQGARLVEICKVAVSTLSHDQMVDLLKTSVLVTVTVIPPLPDGSPRRGCNLPNCKYSLGNYEGDYENVANPTDENNGGIPILSNGKASPRKGNAQLQQIVPGNHRKRYERSFSPPRSSNSSGYGTGSSSKSFTGADRFSTNVETPSANSLSCPPTDERWYELLEPAHSLARESPPPPLPARLGSNAGSAFQHVGSSTGNLMHHNKVGSSLVSPHSLHSFPVTNSYEQLKFLSPDDAYNSQSGIYVKTRPSKMEFTGLSDSGKTSSLPAEVNNAGLPPTDGHSTDTSSASERLCGLHSEDDLSASSNSISPGLRRSGKPTHSSGTHTPSNSSRNQSPRPRDGGEARLRPGVTQRSAQRNSANLHNSTLQEDLMRLINPDYIADQEVNNQVSGASALGKIHSSGLGNANGNTDCNSTETLSSIKARPRDILCSPNDSGLEVAPPSNNHVTTQNQPSQVIVTTARPATVISNASTASSPAPSENKLSKEERLSPRVTKCPQNTVSPLPLPDARDMDWPSLVDTATRAMLTVPDGTETDLNSNSVDNEPLGHWVDDVAQRLCLNSSDIRNVSDLQHELGHLQTRLTRETHLRLNLEEEVRRLRDENRRLHDESQAAAQQLRRFTEWFFQTIDRQ